MRAHPSQTSFNAGEFSPLLMGRPDLAKYANACQQMRNMLPTVQGPAKRRGGTRFTANTKADGKVWFGRFRFSRTQSYILEFGDLYVRFFANRAQLISGAHPVEVETPYTLAQLTNDDGSFALSLQQSNDVIYIASGDHPLKVLRRLGATDWTLSDYVTRNGPMQDQNPNKALRLYASARTGSAVDVTASANYFTGAMIGAFLRLDVENFTMPPWEPGKHFADLAIARSDGKTYQAINTGTNPIAATTVTGSRTLIHEEGRVLDGSGMTADDTPKPIGILWEFRDAGYGYAKIVSITSPTVAVVEVVTDMAFPDHVVGSGNATNAWSIGAWGTHVGAEYPRFVCFWRQRLCLFGLRRFWMSVPQDYDNFARDIVGQVRTDCAITRPLETTERIRWVAPFGAIIVGTESGEFIIAKQTETEALGPNNIDANQVSEFGSRGLQPLRTGKGVLFSQPSGTCVREATYDTQSGEYDAPDLTVLAEHIAKGVIVDWAWQQEPDRIVWAVLATGALVALTKENQHEVMAWHRHPTNGFVEAVQVIPSPDGKRDDLWLCVRRMVAGVPRRFVEVMDAGDEDTRAQEDCYFVDCGLSYSGPPTRRLMGLGHMIGELATIMAMGGTHPPRLVEADGGVSLTIDATKAHAGFGMRAVIVPMLIEAGAAKGTAQGKTKRVDKLQMRFHRTLGAKVGPNEDSLVPVPFRYGNIPLGQATPLFTGVCDPIDFEGDYEKDGTVFIVQDDPLPMTLCSLMPELTTNERG